MGVEHAENRFSMDSVKRKNTSLFECRKLAFVKLPAGPRLFPSMACLLGDKYQLVAHSDSNTSQSQQITF